MMMLFNKNAIVLNYMNHKEASERQESIGDRDWIDRKGKVEMLV